VTDPALKPTIVPEWAGRKIDWLGTGSLRRLTREAIGDAEPPLKSHLGEDNRRLRSWRMLARSKLRRVRPADTLWVDNATADVFERPGEG